MSIALFDSGIGGLTVLSHARRVLPSEEFLFLADRDHVPYGTKTEEEVRGYVRDAVAFLIEEQNAEAVLIACNTATSVAADDMRKIYDVPIIGMEPAVKKALAQDAKRRILVAATPITVRGEKLRRLIEEYDTNHLIDLVALPQLVQFAEREEFVSPRVEEYLWNALAPFDLIRYSSIVLGCTHFNYFKDTLRRILPKTMHFVDGNEGTIEELARRAGIHTEPVGETKAPCSFFDSGRPITGTEAIARLERSIERAARMEEIV